MGIGGLSLSLLGYSHTLNKLFKHEVERVEVIMVGDSGLREVMGLGTRLTKELNKAMLLYYLRIGV